MSMRRTVTNKSRRRRLIRVSIATVVVISAIVFIACKERFIFALPGLVLLAATGATIMLLCQVYMELRSRRWPVAVGLLRGARIVRSYVPTGGMQWVGSSSPPHDYSIVVEYDYVVADKRYKGSRVSFVKKDYDSWKAADGARRHFLQDKKINVFYCPLIPSLSCIAHIQLRDIVISVSAMVAFSAGSLLFTLLAFYYLP